MKFSVIFLGTVAVTLICAGCKSRPNQVIGGWTSAKTGGNFNFNTDHTFTETAPHANGTWSLSKDKVILRLTMVGNVTVDDYILSVVKSQGKSPEDPGVSEFIDEWKTLLQNTVYILSEDGETLTPSDSMKIPTGPLKKVTDLTPN